MWGFVKNSREGKEPFWGCYKQGPEALVVVSALAAAQAPTCDHSDASQMDRQSWPSQLCTADGRGTGQ